MPIYDSVIPVSFRCFYRGNCASHHVQDLRLSEIPKWIECYKFTHPACLYITVMVRFSPKVDHLNADVTQPEDPGAGAAGETVIHESPASVG